MTQLPASFSTQIKYIVVYQFYQKINKAQALAALNYHDIKIIRLHQFFILFYLSQNSKKCSKLLEIFLQHQINCKQSQTECFMRKNFLIVLCYNEKHNMKPHFYVNVHYLYRQWKLYLLLSCLLTRSQKNVLEPRAKSSFTFGLPMFTSIRLKFQVFS